MQPTLELLAPEQAAPLLDCTPATVEDRLRDGTLPGVKFGRSWLIPASALAQALHDQALAEAARRRESAEARPQATTANFHAEAPWSVVPGDANPQPSRRRPPPALNG